MQQFVNETQGHYTTARERLTAATARRVDVEAQLAAAERDRNAAAAENADRREELKKKSAELAELQERLAALNAQVEAQQARERERQRREAEERALAEHKRRLEQGGGGNGQGGQGEGQDGEDGETEGDLGDSLNVSTVPVQRGRGGGRRLGEGGTLWGALECVWEMLQRAGGDRDELQTHVLVPRTLGNYALHERAGGAADEVLVRATKLRIGAPCALKWVPCSRFVSGPSSSSSSSGGSSLMTSTPGGTRTGSPVQTRSRWSFLGSASTAATTNATTTTTTTPGGPAETTTEREAPPEAYAAFVEAYILRHVVHEAVVPLVGIVECASGPTVDAAGTVGATALPRTELDDRVRARWQARLEARGPGFLLELRWVPSDVQHAAAVGAVAPGHAEALAGRLFGALAHLHACGVVHRAVAPWHVRVPDSVAASEAACPAVLAGFGAACTPASDAALVPPLAAPPGAYAAPERFVAGAESGGCNKWPTALWAAGDTWAAACVALEVLLGTRGRPLFCPRVLRALVHGGAPAVAALAQPGAPLLRDYPVLQAVVPVEDASAAAGSASDAADAAAGSGSGSGSGSVGMWARVDAGRLRRAFPGAPAADTRAGRLLELLCSVLVTDPDARPTSAAVVAQLAQLAGRPAPPALPQGPAPWAPATLPALRRFARHHCGFLFRA